MILRRLGRLFAAAIFALLAAAPAAAQDYPAHVIKLVIAFPPGGPTDFVGRLLADKLKDLLGQSVIIENKPGAAGAIGAESVAKAAPDGYTLFLTTSGAVAITPHLHADTPYDPVRDFAPISRSSASPPRWWCGRTSAPIRPRISSRWRRRSPPPSRSRRPASVARRISRSSCFRGRPT